MAANSMPHLILEKAVTSPIQFLQVASGFNCLEFVSEDSCPEDGITCYELDRTQGPACAISCAPATLYRNYFVPVPCGAERFQAGQTSDYMLNGLDVLLKGVKVPKEEFREQAGVVPDECSITV